MRTTPVWEQRRIKGLFLLPLLLVPFVTLAFWALGGGSGTEAGTRADATGLNMTLPEAKQKKGAALDKLRFYEAADRDSATRRRQMLQDRYSLGYRDEELPGSDALPTEGFRYDPAPRSGAGNPAATEQLIYKKLEAINKQVAGEQASGGAVGVVSPNDGAEISPIDALQAKYERANPGAVGDEEIGALNQMMEKILDIQHPERVRSRVPQSDSAGLSAPPVPITLTPEGRVSGFGFKGGYSGSSAVFRTAAVDRNEQATGVVAEIHRSQEVADGSVVQLRLVRPFYLGSIEVAAGAVLHGTARMQSDRLAIVVPAVVVRSQVFPVALKAFDLDGLEGIQVPHKIGGRAVKESVANSFQSIPLISVDPSLKAQAATAGVQAVRSLVGRKVRQVKVLLPTGYRLLLQQSK